MNERQPYEQHLADKMQQLPPPLEPDKAWEKMKILLDKELPRNGTGGNNRWWIIGMIAGILFIGTWLLYQPDPGKNTAAKKPTAVESLPNASQQDQESIAKLPPVQHPPGATKEAPAGNNKNSKANADAARTDQAIVSAKKQVIRDDQSKTDEDIGATIQPIHPIPPNNKLPAYTENSTHLPKSIKENNNKENPPVSNLDTKPKTSRERIQSANSNPELNGSLPADIVTNPFLIETNQLLPSQEMNTAKSFNLQELAVKYKAPKKISRKSDKQDRVFAFGFSLPLAFPVADQKALGYNYRGGSNTVSDYIPSPHVQYHLNRKTFFQTEIQVVSPQYIRPILMYQEKTMTNPNTFMYNSVYARKLYYFNLPVSVYHSPMPNFFLGTGLQFSSLMSGVAMYEDKKVYNNQETILNQQFNRISHDSLTNRMSNSEIRLLLDVNYYWQRFTVGLRYNQAFGNYASFRLNNTTGYTYDKNKALFFYLRYNIWEDKKRNTPARSMLTLK